ncbi:hypothetical protein HY086_05915 [Candidatus Gottesmanbacteria bacterium]|nr:hypothetical protein [Candidatus Gottesmanbacteria bacterium]
MKQLLFLVLLIAVVGVIGLGYFGFVPGLSGILGTNKPRDLGVRATVADYDLYVKKGGTSYNYVTGSAPPGQSFIPFGKKEVTASFSQQEITGRINFAKWKYMPVENVQVKINADGTGEVSGVIRVDRLDGFIAAIGGVSVPPEEIHKALTTVGLGSGNPPFYLKVKDAGVKDNKAFGGIISVEVGRIPVPVSQVNASAVAANLVNTILSKAGIYAKSVSFTSGQMDFSGTVPESMRVETQ